MFHFTLPDVRRFCDITRHGVERPVAVDLQPAGPAAPLTAIGRSSLSLPSSPTSTAEAADVLHDLACGCCAGIDPWTPRARPGCGVLGKYVAEKARWETSDPEDPWNRSKPPDTVGGFTGWLDPAAHSHEAGPADWAADDPFGGLYA